ncbi:MAG: EamA/RhaT family transporter, partial [Bacteroides sp.]
PVTAVCVGISIFGEAVTAGIGLGVGLIIASVTVIILKR